MEGCDRMVGGESIEVGGTDYWKIILEIDYGKELLIA